MLISISQSDTQCAQLDSIVPQLHWETDNKTKYDKIHIIDFITQTSTTTDYDIQTVEMAGETALEPTAITTSSAHRSQTSSKNNAATWQTQQALSLCPIY